MRGEEISNVRLGFVEIVSNLVERINVYKLH